MKKYIAFPFLLLATVFFAGCSKNDGAIDKDIAIDEVPQPSVVINGGSQSIDLTNLASFQGKYTVKLLYPGGIQPEKMDVVIRKNGNNGNVKLIQAGLTTYPTDFTISAAQLVTLFGGVAIALGDNYEIGVDIYMNGKTYQAFPAVGAAYGGTGVANQPGFSPTITYSAICAYNPSIYTGNFVVVEDAWADWLPGDIIVLTQVSANSFSFIDPWARGPLVPAVVTINTGNNVATIARQVVGTSWAWAAAASYPNPTIQGTGSVAPCDKSITLNMDYGFAASTFGGGPYRLKLIKQ